MDNYDQVFTIGVLYVFTIGVSYKKETQKFTELEISSFVVRK